MADFREMMEAQIKAQAEASEQALERALAQQATMAAEMGQEVTDADRQELIDHYRSQAEMAQNMMRQQMEMQAAMMESMGGADAMAAAMAQVQAAMVQAQSGDDDDDDDDEGISEEDLQAFLDAHPVPEAMKKYLTIGALLIGTNDEPYNSLALLGDADDYREGLEENWGIEDRDDALEMLGSLLEGRHSDAFAEDYAVIMERGIEGYDADDDDAMFDEDDLDDLNSAREGLVEVLELDPSYAANCKSLYAWDLDRIGLLARQLSHVGHISQDEAYDWLQKAGQKAAETFDSWEDYIVSLIICRALHMGLSREVFIVAYNLLNDDKAFLEAYPIASLK